MSAQRMHPEDLRAIMAATLASAPDVIWHDAGLQGIAKTTDALLSELARTANPEPEMVWACSHCGHLSPQSAPFAHLPGCIIGSRGLTWDQAESRFRGSLGVGQRIDFDVLKAAWKAEGAKEERERIKAQLCKHVVVNGVTGCSWVRLNELLAALEPKP